MKIKRFNGIIPFLLLIGAILYYRFLMHPGLNEDVPLPNDLHPVVEENTNKLIRHAADQGIQVIVTDGFRSISEQDKLFERGRSTAGGIVTYARGGESYHNFGLAIDFAILAKDGKAIWDTGYDGNGNNKSDWMEVVSIAKGLGFEWGGDWNRFKDYPHLEMNFGLSINQLKRGKRPQKEDTAVSNN